VVDCFLFARSRGAMPSLPAHIMRKPSAGLSAQTHQPRSSMIGKMPPSWSKGPPDQRSHLSMLHVLVLFRPRVVHGGRMKCRHKPGSLQTHHELFPTNTGVMRCLAQPLRGSATKKGGPPGQSEVCAGGWWFGKGPGLSNTAAHPFTPPTPTCLHKTHFAMDSSSGQT